MDPIGSLNYKKDSSLAMLWEAQSRDYEIYYFEQKHLFLRDGISFGHGQRITVNRDATQWCTLHESRTMRLSELSIILMRKDPPFNEEYLYTTFLLEYAERQGSLVVNAARSLRDANEKLFSAYFPSVCPPTIVTSSKTLLKNFWHEFKDIVCKPLNTMGGASIFRLKEDDINTTVTFETLTQNGRVHVVAQKYIPEITEGDKRIILINGEVIPYALARIPQGEDWRGNLAVGARGEVVPLTNRDLEICQQIGPELKARGLYFVGIDVIGNYLTEINVTSPTGIREIDTATGTNISATLFDVLEAKIKSSS